MATGLKTRENQEVGINSEEGESTKARKVFIPKADIFESKEEIVVLAEMPGVSESSVDITLERNVLTISGSVQIPQFDGYSLSYAEYALGDYRRVFSLSNEIDREKIQATVKNGVLKLVLPKNTNSIPKKITVKAAE